ncbi:MULTISPECIES: hypothetical protein [Cyanophyceae]|uniref:hypothetical protein n=1 Tax=Cyanophyceae TaxID=3028117 RepID=UPI001682A77D|nr:hypothetical protein [Trichocoleus sp. FACHB-40]MBD2002720.1 hypothetical protein [Trichocoleus sp. FACHB-40]
MISLINYIRVAKDFADSYGVERLDHLMTLAEADQNSPKTQPVPASANPDAILQEVEAAGFQLNPWLKNLLLSTSVEVVRDAIAVVAENQQWRTVRNPEGLLVEAIRNQWKPNISA